MLRATTVEELFEIFDKIEREIFNG
jgi:hypothetical protein